MSLAEDAPPNRPTVQQMIDKGAAELIAMQEENGSWPYEGVYRVHRKIPVGYRVGGTSLVAQALLYATDSNNAAANEAIDLERGRLDMANLTSLGSELPADGVSVLATGGKCAKANVFFLVEDRWWCWQRHAIDLLSPEPRRAYATFDASPAL